MNALVRDVIVPLRTETFAAADRLVEMGDLDDAEGVWLDLIGLRLGLERPSTSDPTLDRRFGFDAAGEPFDTFPYRGSVANDAFYPLADELYRSLLRARGITVLSDGTTASFTRAVWFIDADAIVVDNRDMTVTVTTSRVDFLTLADRIGALPRPLGVAVTYVAA